MLNKKIIIISNNALSNSNSNGRTLLNLFGVENNNKLAQFYIQISQPEFSVIVI